VTNYLTPRGQTNVLSPGTELVIIGNYDFVDVNANGMADTWELIQFGVVSPQRTMQTDTDSDRFPDFAEFQAGTNPNLGTSRLQLAAPFPLSGNLVRFSWPTTPGRSYQLQFRSGTLPWVPASSWIRASSDVTTSIQPRPDQAGTSFYRVEVRP
jgi:hypothetical protein